MADEQATAEPAMAAEAADAERESPEIPPERLERRREALEQVRRFGDPVLKSRASPVSDFGPDLADDAERMIALMRAAMGIGLAANQVGAMRRMLVFQAGPDATPRALVNPELEWVSDDLVTAEEGCLSIPDVIVDVERPLHARVSARDTEGAAILIEASGLEARVLQHEIDHLDGVLILDRTPREQRRAAMRALRSGERFEPGMLDPDPPAADEERDEATGAAADDPAASAEAERDGPERAA